MIVKSLLFGMSGHLFKAIRYDHNFRVISIPIGISRLRALTIDIAKTL